MLHSAPAWALIVYSHFAGTSAVTINGEYKTEVECTVRGEGLPHSAYFWSCVGQPDTAKHPMAMRRMFRYELEPDETSGVDPNAVLP